MGILPCQLCQFKEGAFRKMVKPCETHKPTYGKMVENPQHFQGMANGFFLWFLAVYHSGRIHESGICFPYILGCPVGSDRINGDRINGFISPTYKLGTLGL